MNLSVPTPTGDAWPHLPLTALLLLWVLFGSGTSAMADDDSDNRPGTPNRERVWECYGQRDTAPRRYAGPPSLCVQFENTARQRVRFEIEATENGRRLMPRIWNPDKVGCLDQAVWSGTESCIAGFNVQGTTHSTRSPGLVQGFYLRQVLFDAEYCFRVRTRDVATDRVSLQSSNWACARTAPKPPPPPAPKITQLSLAEPTWENDLKTPRPWFVNMNWRQAEPAVHSDFRLEVQTKAEQFQSHLPGVFATDKLYAPDAESASLPIPPGMLVDGRPPELIWRVCAYNLSGKACSAPYSTLPPSAVAANVIGMQAGVAGAAKRPFNIAAAAEGTSMARAARVATDGTCLDGFVARRAQLADQVCVPPSSRARVQNENATAAERRNPAGAYGPDSCIAGYVWREAFGGDLVCVSPEVRAIVREENRLGPSRRAN